MAGLPPSTHWVRGRLHLDWVPVCHGADTRWQRNTFTPTGHAEFPIHLTCMSLDRRQIGQNGHGSVLLQKSGVRSPEHQNVIGVIVRRIKILVLLPIVGQATRIILLNSNYPIWLSDQYYLRDICVFSLCKNKQKRNQKVYRSQHSNWDVWHIFVEWFNCKGEYWLATGNFKCSEWHGYMDIWTLPNRCVLAN